MEIKHTVKKWKYISRWGRLLTWKFPILSMLFRRLAILRLANYSAFPEVIPYLVYAIDIKDSFVALKAETALRTLSNSSCIDAFIDAFINKNAGEKAVRIINEQKYRHSVEGRWFLFLVLAGRFDEYLAEDFEFQTLRPEFRAAPKEVQARVREIIIRNGIIRMNKLFITQKRSTILAELSDEDANLLVGINVRNQNWDELFKYLSVLSDRHIAMAVRTMNNANWRPEDPENAILFDKLTLIVKEICDAHETTANWLKIGSTFKKWFMQAESKEMAAKTNTELRNILNSLKTPPEKITALAALVKKKALSNADMEIASGSPHWLLRLAAASVNGMLKKGNNHEIQWIGGLAPAFSKEMVWGGKPCNVTRESLEILQKGLAMISMKKDYGGLLLLEAIAAHNSAYDIEIEIGVRVIVGEDSFEIES